VFLATPGDLLAERDAFIQTCVALSGTQFDVQFEPLGWESVPASTGARPQEQINALVDAADIFVFAMLRRWGQEAPDASPFTSYTEEELRRALKRLERTGSPEIFCFFKQVDAESLADAGPELKKVLALKRRMEESGRVLYRVFATPDDFARELHTHLTAFAQGTLPTPRNVPRFVNLSIPEDFELRSDEEAVALGLVREAVSAIGVGQVPEASQLLARAAQATTDVRLLDLVHRFFNERGERVIAEGILDRRLALTRDRRLAARLYAAVMPDFVEDAIQNASRSCNQRA
jgi:hypothetical protein